MKKLFLTIFITFILIFSSSTFNQTKATNVSPDKYFIDLLKDEKKDQVLRITGSQGLTEKQTLYVYVLGMRKVGEQNEREFYIPDGKTETDVANWITLSTDKFEISKGELKEISWTINNRDVAACGTNLAAIAISTSPSTNAQGSQVALKNEIISQVHVYVKGKTNEDCSSAKVDNKLAEFKINSNSNYFFEPDVPFITKISNEGNLINQDPRGFIEIFQAGKKIDTVEFNKDNLDIYPKTTRKFDNIWLDSNYPKDGFFDQLVYELKNLRIGQFEARLGVTQNSTPHIVATTTFWLIPWKALSLLALIVLVFTIVWFINKRNKKKSYHMV